MHKHALIWLALIALAAAQTAVIPIDRRSNDLIQPQGPGEINWTRQVITAKGWGVIDTTMSPPQARLMATRAAMVVAQRNLLEIIKGVTIQSETKVEDFETKYDYITSELNGVVRGAKMLGSPKEKDGVIEVEMANGLYDEAGIAPPLVKPLAPSKPEPGTGKEAKDAQAYTSLAIDASGTGAQPALFPRLTDQQGNVLFDPAQYYNAADSQARKILNFVSAAKTGIDSLGLGNNPYVIKAVKAIGSDLVIDDKTVQKVVWLKKAFQAALKVGKVLLYLM